MEIQIKLKRKRYLLWFDEIVDRYIKLICRSNVDGIVTEKLYHTGTTDLLIGANIFFYCSRKEWDSIYLLLKSIYLFPEIKTNENGICRLSISDINRDLYPRKLLAAVPRTVVSKRYENSDGDN